MKRRDFIAGVGAATLWAAGSGAQQSGGKARIAVMTNTAENDLDEQSRVAVFRDELRQLGWSEGSNIQIDSYWTKASIDLAKKYAADIVRSKPDVIFVIGTTTVSIIREHTHSIPIVFVSGADPVKAGFVSSFAKPGGNATGFVDLQETMGAKWLQILKETVPTIDRVVVLDTDSQATLMQLPLLEDSAAGLGARLFPVNVRDAAGIERAFESYAGETNVGLIVLPSSIAAVNRKLIIAQAARYRLPAMYPNRRYPADGGLMSYAGDRVVQYKRSAAYVDRMLRGARPEDLPAQLQDKFDLVLNLKTAKALGLVIPRIVLIRAAELIE